MLDSASRAFWGSHMWLAEMETGTDVLGNSLAVLQNVRRGVAW